MRRTIKLLVIISSSFMMHGMQKSSLPTLDAYNAESTIQDHNREKKRKKREKKEARHSKRARQKLKKRQDRITFCQLNAALYSLDIPVEQNDVSDFNHTNFLIPSDQRTFTSPAPETRS